MDSIQVIFNLFEQRAAHELFPVGAASKTAFIDRVAFDSGSLSGRWTEETFSTGRKNPCNTRCFAAIPSPRLKRVEALKRLCAPYYSILAEAAMRYTLSSPQVSSVIAGVRPSDHVDSNVSYSDGVPSAPELLTQLAEHNWPQNYYT